MILRLQGDLAPLIAKSGGIIPFRYRCVKQIAKAMRSHVSESTFALVDFILHELFNKVKLWIKEDCWKIARLFFIARKKENSSSCPASTLAVENIIQILEYANLMNTEEYPVSVNSEMLDSQFKKNLPASIYQSAQKYGSYHTIETKLRKVEFRHQNELFRIQYYFPQRILFHSVHYISKRIANFTYGASIYLSCLVEGISERIIHNASSNLGKRMVIQAHDLFLSTTMDQEILNLIENFECPVDWKWIVEENNLRDSLPESITKARPHSLTQSQVQILERENYLRQLFVQNRDSKELSNPYVGLIDIYENINQFQYEDLDQEEMQLPMILEQKRQVKMSGIDSVNSYENFLSNLNQLISGAFEGMDWSNVFLAGGAVLSALIPQEKGFEGSDLDLFIYSPFEEDANEKVEAVLSLIEKNSSLNNFPIIVQTKNTVSIVRGFPHRNIQIIFRLYKSPAEILLGFDVDACSVGFDGKKVWATERAKRAINKKYNLVNPTRRSSSYEYRLWKYSKRGFGVCIPNLDGTKINYSTLLNSSITQVKGLAKLLFYERGRFSQEFLQDSIQRKRDLERDVYDKDSQNLNIIHSKVDYSHISIPYGPKWTPFRILEFLNKRNWGISWTQNPNKPYLHVFTGVQSFISKNAKENIIWLVKNPGQQEFEGMEDAKFLRGSFYPLPSQKWEEDAYIFSSE